VVKHCYKEQPGKGESYSHPPTSILHILVMGALCIHVEKKTCKVLSESYRTIIAATASVKEDERGGQVHTSASLSHQSATSHPDVNTHCFYMSARLTSCFVLSAMDGKIEHVSASGFAWSSVNPLPKSLKCFMRLLENIL
jgi:hypothetical protein